MVKGALQLSLPPVTNTRPVRVYEAAESMEPDTTIQIPDPCTTALVSRVKVPDRLITLVLVAISVTPVKLPLRVKATVPPLLTWKKPPIWTTTSIVTVIRVVVLSSP
jgi:hypothetical protein